MIKKMSEKFNITGKTYPMQDLGDAIIKKDTKKALALIPLCLKDIDNNHGIVPPLVLAVSNKNLTVVNALLDAGANPNIKRTFTKFAPLELALLHDFVEISTALVEKGADVKGLTHKGKDTYLNAVLSKATTTAKPKNEEEEKSYLRLIQAMIDNGADVSKKNRDGLSPIKQVSSIIQNSFLKDVADILVKGDAKTTSKVSNQLKNSL